LNFTKLNTKYQENLKNQSKKLTIEEKNPIIEEPKPGSTHVICAVCREQFKDYYEHVFSARHRRGVSSWSSIFLEIDKTIKDVVVHQSDKRRRNLDLILKSGHSNLNFILNPEDKQLS